MSSAQSADGASTTAAAPWWVRARAPWHGSVFQQMRLGADDPGEQRIQRLRDEVSARPGGKEGTVCLERARLMTAVYRETEGEPEVIRRALAFDRVLRQIGLPLSRDQLLAGSPASIPYGVEVEPEFQATWLEEMVEVDGQTLTELDALAVRPSGGYHVSPEDRAELLAEIIPYWRQRDHKGVTLRELARNYPEAFAFYRDSQVCAHIVGGGISHTIQDYAAVLRKGLTGLVAELRAAAGALDPLHPRSVADFERRNLFEAMVLLADATIAYARRYSTLLAGLAATEPDPGRAAELGEMARICWKVPAEPAETWWEALQSWTILHAVTTIVEAGGSHSAGRFDQYMLPYLERDLAAGRLTPRRAQELLECFYVKFCERLQLRSSATARAVSGFRANDKLTIGGIDRAGRDATNALTWMCLEALAHVHLNDPNVSLRLHRGTPPKLLHAALEVLRLGGGLPQLISDEVIAPALVETCGVAPGDARDYADIGCQENVTDPNMDGAADCNGRTNAGYLNFAKAVELALHDGVNQLNGKQVGPRTGDPRAFAAMADFAGAVRAQIERAVEMIVVFNNVFDYAFRRVTPTVYHSLMHPGPRRTGFDYSEGGCKYNWTGATCVGLANAADSLAAVEQVVYERRLATWDELLVALGADWRGHERLRRACLAAPKYGADDERADRWARFILDVYFDAYERCQTPRGGRFVGGLYTMGHYITRGELTAATPDGRRRGELLADSGVSPSSHAPGRGPTATHLSVTRALDARRSPNGVTFNQRFSQSLVGTAEELAKLGALVRAYVAQGGQAVQYNVVDREALLAAQRHPELYRDLIVRVGGYSALFVDLSREIQDSIIARAEQRL